MTVTTCASTKVHQHAHLELVAVGEHPSPLGQRTRSRSTVFCGSLTASTGTSTPRTRTSLNGQRFCRAVIANDQWRFDNAVPSNLSRGPMMAEMRPVVFSASSVNSRACHLRWWFTYVLLERGEVSEAQATGIAAHIRRTSAARSIDSAAAAELGRGRFGTRHPAHLREAGLIEAPFQLRSTTFRSAG
jgi:hypothetical protein